MKPSDTNPLSRVRMIWNNRYEPEYAHAFVDLYWRALLVTACVIVIGACAYGATDFFDALSQLSASPAVAPAAPSSSDLDQATLDATLEGFAARQADFQSLQAGPIPPLPDPSN